MVAPKTVESHLSLASGDGNRLAKYWNRQGSIVLAVGLLAGLLAHTIATGFMGPDSLRARGVAWIVCGICWVVADVADAIQRRKPMKQLAWVAGWSGGLAGFSVSFLGIVALIGGVSYIIGPDSV
jgi:hypothetical protein